MNTTMEQLKLSINADMMKLRSWLGRWDVFASQQAGCQNQQMFVGGPHLNNLLIFAVSGVA